MENPSLGEDIFSQFDDDLSSIRTDRTQDGWCRPGANQ